MRVPHSAGGVGDAPSTAERYQHFAKAEAHGRSPLYESLSEGVAGDPELLALLDSLPSVKRQPNLVLAVVQFLYGTQVDYPTFRAAVIDHRDEVTAHLMVRRNQVNEVGRCAVLLPALARLPQPLALIEVGAAAGLCLLLDRYSYDYGGHRLGDGAELLLSCRPIGPVPLPKAMPAVAWRAGVDLAPLDVDDRTDRAWLEALVWPEQPERLDRLRAAMEIARVDPPMILRANLLDGLAELAAGAPSDSTLVVFHSAALGYLSEDEHAEFAGEVARLGAIWLSNEGPGVLPGLAHPLPPSSLAGTSHFVLTRNGIDPLALAHPHGDWLAWAESSATH